MSGDEAIRRACACSDFSRSELLRRGVAEAGAGLRPIEPGMPLPAGTGLTRRRFLAQSAGLALAVYGGAALLRSPLLESGIAAASGSNERVLVSVFLDGGADGLSVLFPTGDPLYKKLRPSLALPGTAGTAFTPDPRLRWHPSASALAKLYGEGKVVVAPAIGYTDPDQSHFTSRHYWEVGATDAGLQTGWLGRYLDRHGRPDNPLQGLSLEGYLEPALATAKVPVAAVDGVGGYDFGSNRVWGDVETEMLATLETLGSQRFGDPALREAAGITLQAHRLRERLEPFKDEDSIKSPVAYPGGDDQFPRKLAGVAALLAAGLPLHCVALTAPGMYDTHSDQPGELAEGLKLTFDSLAAFQRDLEARGLADRVLVHVWSEFGRRAEQNASNGTDHGAAGVGFLVGTKVKGQMLGEFPGLKSGLDDDGNLKATTDFRGVYGALLEQWFDADADAIIPQAKSFERPSLIR